jgi:ASC-1-like (ASCH) protein
MLIMRTITLSYPGLDDVEVQIATGKKAVEVRKLIDQLVKTKDGEELSDEQFALNLELMAEMVSKCTRYSTKEEVIDTFSEAEIAELSMVIQGDRETIKKAQTV